MRNNIEMKMLFSYIALFSWKTNRGLGFLNAIVEIFEF